MSSMYLFQINIDRFTVIRPCIWHTQWPKIFTFNTAAWGSESQRHSIIHSFNTSTKTTFNFYLLPKISL